MKNTFLIIGIMICIALSVPTTINATDNKINNKSEAVKADDMENMTKSDQMQFEKQLLKTKSIIFTNIIIFQKK